MIRINLLPQAKRQTAGPSGSAQAWFVGYAFGVLVWGAALVFVYVSKSNELEEQAQQNTALEGRIGELKARTAGLEEKQRQLAESQKLQEVVDELHRARLGPTRVLMELSSILSVGGGPTIDPRKLEQMRTVNPHAGFNRNWDPRRLWLTEFSEAERACSVKGLGRTNDDVGEFLQRLSLSELFDEVTLLRTQAETTEEERIAVIGFEVSCKVRY